MKTASKQKPLVLKKVRVHNLKEISLSLNPQELIVFTGLSGSGKSSLAFDTIFAEGQRRYIESLSPHLRRRLNEMPKPDAEEISGISPVIAVEQKTLQRNPRSTLGTQTGIYDYLRVLFARIAIPHCPISGEAVAIQSREKIFQRLQNFSEGEKLLFLSPYAKRKKATFAEDFAEILHRGFTKVRIDREIVDISEGLKLDGKFPHDIDIVIDRLTYNAENLPRLGEALALALEEGKGFFSVVEMKSHKESFFSQYAHSPKSGLSYGPLNPFDFSFNHPSGSCLQCQGLGFLREMRTSQESLCPSCKGSRLRPYPSAALLGKKRIFDITAMTSPEALLFFQKLSLDPLEKKIALELIQEIEKRLQFLIETGLGYLSLDRRAPSLSGGEAQRIKLASHLCAGLAGTTYILDEPSIGLHPQDQKKLLKTLKKLRDTGNRILVVEHDRDTLLAADTLVELGPLSGKEGGQIVFQGSVEEILKDPHSLTGAYLSGRKTLPLPQRRRKPSEKTLILSGISHHNLKNLTVSFPLEIFVSITGLSGSGKSSLIEEVLFYNLSNHFHKTHLPCSFLKKIEGIEHIKKVLLVDQSPIGRTPRSNPATYVKIWEEIRDLFASLPESKAKGYTKGHFSFNSSEGACPHCGGRGEILIEREAFEKLWILCPECRGKRFSPEILSLSFKGKNIQEILEMEISQALTFFASFPNLFRKLKLLEEVGLGYLALGQASSTLSGGEAQRIKLAKELARPSGGKTLYLLDEPTTGLHFHDIEKLLGILQRLVDKGNSIIVIEHNMDLVKMADWIIEMGPEAGEKGGKIIAEGPPEAIIKKKTPTALVLKDYLYPQKKTLLLSPPKKEKAPSQELLEIHGACQNTLKNLSIDLPHNALILFSGPSGSGKSSLAFETIYAEGQRRYIETLPLYSRQFLRLMPKPKVDEIFGLKPSLAIEQKGHGAQSRSTVGTLTEIYDLLRTLFAYLGIPYCPETGERIRKVDREYVINQVFSLAERKRIHVLAPIAPLKQENFSSFLSRLAQQGFLRLRLNGKYFEIDEKIPYHKYLKNEILLVVDRFVMDESHKDRLREAVQMAMKISENKLIVEIDGKDHFFHLAFTAEKSGKSYPPITPKTFSFNAEEGKCPSCKGLGFLEEKGFHHKWGFEIVIATKICLDCKGSRLNPLARHVKLKGKTLPEFCALDIEEALSFLLSLEKVFSSSKKELLLEEKASNELLSMILPVLEQLKLHLLFLQEIGLGYLSIDRMAPTLSSGELQRVRLARQLSSGLTSCIYVLDEPTTGLHPHENELLLKALKKLKDKGNTLLVVEHDPLLIEEADFLCDFGPGAGKKGGEIVASGSVSEVKKNPNSLTGAYLLGKKKIPFPKERRKGKNFLKIEKASIHNLSIPSLSLPLETFCCISGVSGSGKSTLLYDLLLPALKKSFQSKERVDSILLPQGKVSGLSVFEQSFFLDQSPIGQTFRSDIATYTEVLTPLRHFFSSLPLSKAKGFLPAHFSYNHKKGMCHTCFGLGYKTIYLQFLPPVRIPCESCKGFRLSPMSLEVTYKGKHLGQILEMTIDEAKEFFAIHPKIFRKLDFLISVGLGYLSLRQELSTLSGGEAQRIRLSLELAKRPRGKAIYLFDEPTHGLHANDIAKLLPLFHRLVKQGHSLFVIEHHLDVLANADFITDLGPGAGKNGGKVIASGTPEEIARARHSLTGKYLARHLAFL